MALGGGTRVLMAASKGIRHGKLPKGKAKDKSWTPLPSSELGKYLRIPEKPQWEPAVLVSKFVKLHMRQNPEIKKNTITEEKLRSVLEGKDSVGISEIVNLLNPKPTRTFRR